MAITTLDGLIGGTKGAGMVFKTATKPAVAAGFWASYWAAGTIPAAGALATGNTTAGIIPTEATTGAMAFTDPTGGATSYVMGATVQSTVTGVVYLYDRVFAIGALAPASGPYAGPVTGTTINRPADGAGVEMWAEIVTALNANAHTVTVTYDDQDNNSSSGSVVLAASAPIARMYPATLASGDSGVQHITAISGSATPPTGTFNLVLARPIIRVGVIANQPIRLGIPETGLRPLFADSCLALAFYNPAGTTAPDILVSLDLTTG
jgi:hypothetical protein